MGSKKSIHVKMKNICLLKHTIKRVKKQDSGSEKAFAKWVVVWIYTEFLWIDKKLLNTQQKTAKKNSKKNM